MSLFTSIIVQGSDSRDPTIKSIRHILSHPGLEQVSGSDNEYKVKEGYELPVVKQKCVPDYIGNDMYEVYGALGPNSTFTCDDNLCTSISVKDDVFIKSETYTGWCIGNGCKNVGKYKINRFG